MIPASRDAFWRGDSLCNSMFTNGLPALYGSQIPCCLPPFDCAAGSHQLEQYTHKALLRFIAGKVKHVNICFLGNCNCKKEREGLSQRRF